MDNKELITDALDVLVLLALAVGVTLGLWPLIAGWSVACGGAVVYIGARIIDGSWRKSRGGSP